MAIDLELYRRQVRISSDPLIRLSAIDISPDHPNHTILFLHGYGGQAYQWQYQLQEFSFSNRVIALDLRGHGRSDKPSSGYSMASIQRDLEIAFNELDVEDRFILVGHSFGGAIATEYAIAHHNRVSQLILIATAGEFKLNPLYRALLQLPLPILRSVGVLVRGWLSAPPHVMYAWYHNNLSTWNGWSLFRSLEVPTLVVRGHLDIVFAEPMFEEVARAIPGAEEIDVGASGHLVMLERREAVNRAIKRSLDSNQGTWRDEPLESPINLQESLINERPWLNNYDAGVPYTIAIPPIPLHYFLRSTAHRFPHHTAIIFEGNRITYRRLIQEIYRFANALRSLGVNRGDRVMLLLPNSPQMVIAFYGILEAGAIAVFNLPFINLENLIHQLQETSARVFITLAEFDSTVQKMINTFPNQKSSPLEHVIYTDLSDYMTFSKQLRLSFSRRKSKRSLAEVPTEAKFHSFNRLLSSHNWRSPEIPTTSDDLAVIQYTGGTTAEPKGVMLTHRNLVANALQTRHWMPSAQEGKERFLSVLPFSHSYGLTAGLNVPFTLGATLIIKTEFNVLEVLKTIKRNHPTIFPGVPRMYLAIKDFHGVRKFGISSIKACISGSAPLPVEVQEAFEKLTRGRLVEGYGLTEASPVTHANPLEGKRKVGSIGMPLPSTEARVVDLAEGTKEVTIGQIGELAVRGPQTMRGYWKAPMETEKVLDSEGWLLTGDIAQMDAEGYFRIIARKADLWYPDKRDRPAFPRDVEEVIYEIPQIQEVAVVAIANQPIAFVIAQKERPSVDSIIAFCKRRLPPDMVPRFVIFVEDFPRTFIGKVIRRELTRRYEQHLETIPENQS